MKFIALKLGIGTNYHVVWGQIIFSINDKLSYMRSDDDLKCCLTNWNIVVDDNAMYDSFIL